MRPIWKGSLRFSLVSVPIALYPATRHEDLKFRLLRASDLSPVNYKRVAEVDGREVPWDQIVKGYEYEAGKYVVLKDEDFRRVDIEATQTAEIIDFVPLEEINPIYFDKPYYLEPQKGGEKAYTLLREALKRTRRVGIAKVVIKTRQHLASIKPQGDALVLELMHFADELIKPDNLKIPSSQEGAARELDLATDLVKRMSDKWKPERYSDDYRSALKNLIQEKIERGSKATPGPGQKNRQSTNVVDLAAVLQESLEQTKSGSANGKKTRSRSGHKKAA